MLHVGFGRYSDLLARRDTAGCRGQASLGSFTVFLELVELRGSEALLAENILLEPPWQDGEELVVHVRACWDGEDVVEFYRMSVNGIL